MRVKLHKTKKDALFSRLIALGLFNSSKVKELGHEMFFDTAYRRLQEHIQLASWGFETIFRRIPDFEARERGLTKEGNKRLAYFEVK